MKPAAKKTPRAHISKAVKSPPVKRNSGTPGPPKPKKAVGKKKPETPKEKTIRAIDEAARLYWEGASWKDIAVTLYQAGAWRRQTAKSAQDVKHEYPELWAEACERWRRRLFGTADRDAYLTQRNLLAYKSPEIERLEKAIQKLKGEDLVAGLVALARLRREDHILRQRAAHSIQSAVQRNRERSPIELDMTASIGPLTDATRQQLGDEIVQRLSDPKNADLRLSVKGTIKTRDDGD